MGEPLVAAEGVSRSYDGGRVVALHEVTLAIHPGDFAAITGPSGSGKSTLLNLLSGLDRPTQGRVLFEGREPRTRRRWTAIRSRRIGLVFQQFNLLATLTARQNVEMPLFGVVASAAERRRRAASLLDRVGLAHRADHRPHELSVGERQRVAIARSLVNSPALILADEPTGSLDTHSAASVLHLLTEIHESEGVALVIVTHDLGIAERARRRVSLRDGRVEADDRA
jgi:putative ABC transport system ATP-binding protein